MGTLQAVIASTASNAPFDWIFWTVASLVFIALIAVPAAALNARDRKRRQQAKDRARAAAEGLAS